MPAARSVESLGAPGWLAAAAAELTPARPGWVKSLPPVALAAGGRLPVEFHPWLLGAIKATDAEAARHDLLEALPRHAERESLDAWYATAVQAWVDAGSPAREAWLLAGAASCGGSATASALHDAVRAWSVRRERLLTMRGVDALSRLDAAAAHAATAALASSPNARAVAREAGQVLAKLGAAEGHSAESMADRHAETGGLDARGERVFRLASRAFRASLGADLRLSLFDEQGRRRAGLPPAAAGEDLALRAVRDAWAQTKRSVARSVRDQGRRFERLMVSGREWDADEFRLRVLAHPILGRLARLLVWQTAGGSTFRVAEDFTLADAADESFMLGPSERVRIVHPLHLRTDELDEWRARFADYALMPPFPQLARECFRCGEAEAAEDRVPSPPHAPLKATVLYGILHHDGWTLGRSSALVQNSWKAFAADGVTASISYTGFYPAAAAVSPDQTLDGCAFFAGAVGPVGIPLPLGRVPAMAFSEARRRLHRLAADRS